MMKKLFNVLLGCCAVSSMQACFVGFKSMSIAARTAQTLISGGAPCVSGVTKIQCSREHSVQTAFEDMQRSLNSIETWSNQIRYANKRFLGCKSLAFEERHPVRIAVKDAHNLNLSAYEESDASLDEYDDNRAIIAYCRNSILVALRDRYGSNKKAIDKEYERLLSTINMTPQGLKRQMVLAMTISHHYQAMHMQQKTQRAIKELNGRLDCIESKLSTLQKTQASSQDELIKILREHTKPCSNTLVPRLRDSEIQKNKR